MKMLTGILKSDSGKIDVDGYEPFRDRIKYTKEIGVVFGQRTQIWWELPVNESFELIKDIYSVDSKIFTENMKLFSQLFNLDTLLAIPVKNLSLGQRMLCDVAAAFVHNPRIVYLDEPTIGLDINIKENIRKLILQINKEIGTTVILTTHDISDIKALCERIIVIDKGSILYDGSLNQIASLLGQLQEIRITLGSSMRNDGLVSSLNAKYSKNELVSVKVDNNNVVIASDSEKISASELLRFIFSVEDVNDIKISDPDVEFVIKKVYSGEYYDNRG
jgi:ABC-2 type transport system ATP-binding protein